MNPTITGISTEDIINAVQKRPVLWDATGGKTLKARREAWTEVMTDLVINYQDLNSEQKTQFGKCRLFFLFNLPVLSHWAVYEPFQIFSNPEKEFLFCKF